MGPLELLSHLANFLAPALWLALVLPLAARLFMKKAPSALTLWRQTAINFLVNALVLAFGLWFFGRDGKMATYAGVVVLGATSQWLMLRGWRA